jgi:hypothetical protein
MLNSRFLKYWLVFETVRVYSEGKNGSKPLTKETSVTRKVRGCGEIVMSKPLSFCFMERSKFFGGVSEGFVKAGNSVQHRLSMHYEILLLAQNYRPSRPFLSSASTYLPVQLRNLPKISF